MKIRIFTSQSSCPEIRYAIRYDVVRYATLYSALNTLGVTGCVTVHVNRRSFDVSQARGTRLRLRGAAVNIHIHVR